MIQVKFLMMLMLAVSCQICLTVPIDTASLEKETAMKFLNSDGNGFEKRLIYTGKEQRAEAKENYEEKCERSAFSRLRGKPRWCPSLSLWPEWMEAVRKDKVDY